MAIAIDSKERSSSPPYAAAALIFSIAALFISLCVLLLVVVPQTNETKRKTSSGREIAPRTFKPEPIVVRYRQSVCYIFTSYTISDRYTSKTWRSAGTGFVVEDGLIATNRHVIQPWWGEPDEEALLRTGARLRTSRILAFFPGLQDRLVLSDPIVSASSDVALLHFAPPRNAPLAPPLPLATELPIAGEPITVLGYPAGVTGMLAKALPARQSNFTNAKDPVATVRNLAKQSLIRPVATYGQLGDVTDERLIYDAHTAPGGSGGPVINLRGEVIGINSAYVEGFSGGNVGIPIAAVRALLGKGSKKRAIP